MLGLAPNIHAGWGKQHDIADGSALSSSSYSQPHSRIPMKIGRVESSELWSTTVAWGI